MIEDDEEVRGAAPVSLPLLATLAGVALLVLAAIAAPLLLPPQPLAVLIGAGIALGAMLWLVVLLAVLRGAGLGWRAGSAAVLMATGAAAGLVTNGQFQSRARADASSFADVEPTADGTLRFPGDAAGRGPISRRFAAVAAAETAAQQRYGEGLTRLGAAALNSPYLLTQDPRAISNCAAFAGLRGETERAGTAQTAERRALRQAIADARLPESAKHGIARMAGADGEDPRQANRLAMLDATQQLCQLLARRGWYNLGGLFGFRAPADEAAFRKLQATRQQLAADAEQLNRSERDRMLEGREAVRDALSQSVFVSQ